MKLTGLEDSLSKISDELEEIEQRREKILKVSRDVVNLSAKSIVSMHLGDMKGASVNLKSAAKILRELRADAHTDLQRYLVTPEGEYVEAKALYSIASSKAIPSREELGVSSAAYLFGLLDVIGEIKREIYDMMRKRQSEKASDFFSLMERLYTLLLPFSAYDHVAQGLRRKLDVARILVEDTRSAVTEEVRRSELMRSMKDLGKKLSSRKSG